MIYVFAALVIVTVTVLLGALRKLRAWNASIWLPAYVKGDWAGNRESPAPEETVDVMLCIADHFEPGWNEAGAETQEERVDEWVYRYQRLAENFRDADGCPPKHTFFFPAEQYRPELLDALGELVETGYGEVEVHLHHDRDTSRRFRRKVADFVERLQEHGMLGVDASTGTRRFGFVHGDWALDNSMPDGSHCGVNDEIRILKECGCYADFTLPSAPSPAQTSRINSIYYAEEDPARPKSHDDGREVAVKEPPAGDLMMIQGPLTMIWPGGTFWLLPRPENSQLPGGVGLSRRRVDAWMNTRICVAGRPEWVFVKLHAHGCPPANRDQLLGPAMEGVHRYLADRYNDGERYRLHYVTAREMYNIVKAAEQGREGNPGQYRDFRILPPPLQRSRPETPTAREIVLER